MIQTEEKEQVIKAINELGRRVTAADVATKTGLPILKTSQALNTIASETQGHLEVSTTGDVAYKFNTGFQTVYLATGIKKVLQQIWQGAFSIGYYLLRISFGIMLIVSFILVIFLVIAAVMIMMKGSSDRDDDSGFGGGGFRLDFFDYMILRDLLWWGTYSSYPTTYIDYDRPTTRVRPKSNFLLNVFSFLFGDGNPNLNLEERKWQSIAHLIKDNHGVVTAEQLAPYTGADPKNEDGVLPVLVRFDGKPEVTENGNIIYQFPSLQVSAASEGPTRIQKFLQEFRWQFTAVPAESLIPVYILAGVNFLGSWWLLYEFDKLAMPMGLLPLILSLVTYGTLFLLVPTIRYFILKGMNERIEGRNQRREDYALALANPTPDLTKKLAQARSMSIGEKRLTAGDVVYTTEKDALEQEFDQEFDASP